ncbi:MAG: zinc-finger domain-containing protein [Pseudomonadota bacterium]
MTEQKAYAPPAAPDGEIVVVQTKRVMCDGGGGALGHPKVWYDMAAGDCVECKYCDRIFVLKGGSKDPTA